jgi:hypothetical protein
MSATASDPWLAHALRNAEEMRDRNLSPESVLAWNRIAEEVRGRLEGRAPLADESPVPEPGASQDGATAEGNDLPRGCPGLVRLPESRPPLAGHSGRDRPPIRP